MTILPPTRIGMLAHPIKRVFSAGFAPYTIALFGVLLTRSILTGATVRADAAWVAAVAIPWGLLIHRKSTTPSPFWVLLGALSIRFLLVGAPPLLSDDLYRYLWEGVMGLGGYNPYLHAPDMLPGIADSLRTRVNHGYATSIYPPGAHLWFQAAASMDPRPSALQGLTSLVDVLNVALLLRLCRQRGLGRLPAWIYALHPLPVLASASGAHIDVLCLCFALGACAVVAPHRKTALVTLASWIKLFPVMLLFPVWRSSRSVGFWITFGGTSLLVLAQNSLLRDAGWKSVQSLLLYANHWSFNGLLYPWLAPIFGGATRPILVALAACAVLWVLRNNRDMLTILGLVSVVFVVTSPTMHPWYGLWLFAPGSVLWGTRATAPLTFLLCGYGVLFGIQEGVWSEPWWLWWSTWLPAIAGAVWLYRGSSPSLDPNETPPTAP